MIARLQGKLILLQDNQVIIDVQGVGYLVHISTKTADLMPPHGGDVTLLIETQVREDAINLFGFGNAEEKRAFNLLTTVQGVGAKVALGILSTLAPMELYQAILTQDKAAVSQAQGVGPKLALRLLTELKDKVGKIDSLIPATTSKASAPSGKMGTLQDAVSALQNLGYKPHDAAQVVGKILAQDADAPLSSIITKALSELANI